MSEKYIEALSDAIRHTHGCASKHVGSVPVKETFNGEVVWDGNVEVFELDAHQKAKQCYAWGYKDDGGRWQYVAVLNVPPVDTALAAVQAYIVSRKN